MKQYLKVDPSRVVGFGVDAYYAHDYSVLDQNGVIIASGTVKGKPFGKRLPEEYRKGWVVPEKYGDMKSFNPIDFPDLPWERVV